MFLGKPVILENNCYAGKKAKETFKTLRDLRSRQPKKVFLGHLNINLLRNKFEPLNELIRDTFDIVLVNESSFPDSQFSIPGYRINRKIKTKMRGNTFLH